MMNKREALLCSRICRLTYVDQYEFSDFQLTARFENAGTDTQGIFGIAFAEALVVAFRGSEETGLADWITNLKFFQNEYPYAGSGSGAEVHRGFLEAYTSVREAVINMVKNAAQKRVICTGHSLGGALAALCAIDVQHNVAGKTVACYTFGSPKVGNKAFAELYDRSVPDTFRLVNGADGVPRLPPGPYYHVGQLQQYGQADASLAEVAEAVVDHLPNAYIKTLQDLA
jgi:predicted lipase